ncbi:response regulator transcription factor [Salinimonas sp. HHU 13199]|uniref:Response regulator transcription factor n=1 Tax=Salinimonas profundi TaxID=2729140 RepID=A0ABR8LFH6_9ALTE|nr:response regulator transcription factor [Salinimonas profundi]MBD3585016.1 response regulator transcription factor [Salinimonas profundi]
MSTPVLIADDHPLFRAAMKQAVCGVVGEAILESSTLAETLDTLAANPEVELLFLDLNMPGTTGLNGLGELLNRYPDILTVVVSAQDEPALIRRVMDIGACGFIPKSTPLDEITSAVEKIMQGENWLPEHVQNDTLQPEAVEQTRFAHNLAQLTPHQYTVLKMLAAGLLNKQIAFELSISESTVKQHVSAVLRKLQVVNRTQAGVLFNQLVAEH